MRDEVPDYLRSAFGRLTETAAELDTLVLRANEMPLPEFEPIDPEELAEAAKDPNAPAELRAVAQAVAERRTTWAEVASGGGRDVPEINDLLVSGADRIGRVLAGEDVDAPPPTGSRRGGAPDDNEDFSDWNFVRKER